MYIEVGGTIRSLPRFEFAVAYFFRLGLFSLSIFSFLFSGEVFQILMIFYQKMTLSSSKDVYLQKVRFIYNSDMFITFFHDINEFRIF